MMWSTLSLAAVVSVIAFPFPLTVVLALGAGAREPLIPLLVGALTDAMYLPGSAYELPWFTILGGLASFSYLIVHRHLRPGTMQ